MFAVIYYVYFNCGKVGHYASKCTEKKNNEYDPRENFRKLKMEIKNTKKIIIYTQEDSSFESGSNQSSNEEKNDEGPK